MLLFGFFPTIQYPLFGRGLQTGGAYASIGLTNDLKRQENACRLFTT